MEKKAKTLEQATKKELIELIIKIRPKATAYENICKFLKIDGNILTYINALKDKISRPKNINNELNVDEFISKNGNGVMFIDGMYYPASEVARLLTEYASN